jgi:hypothetical protein
MASVEPADKRPKLEEPSLAKVQGERPSYAELQAMADGLLQRAGVRPAVGIICGSGLGGLADRVENAVSIDYHTIPGFPVSTGGYQHQQGRLGLAVLPAGMQPSSRCWCVLQGGSHGRTVAG